ncbi:sugar-binding domain-containing protein [Puia sp. P3]|uniref:sugar-binding domain-containing protein n=1 Tax=Puia sp. P3 TaxID=3423952 RepID=UPI003D6657EC
MAKYREKDNLKLPFWLTPARHYVGAAWYQREVVVPSGWRGRRVRLYLERPHSETTVWVDGIRVGTEFGYCTAQEFGLGVLSPGRHRITLRIDNRIKDINVGQDSHSLTDQTQGNWNGVVGKLLLEALAPVRVEDVQVFPDVAGRRARVRILIRSSLGSVGSGMVELSAKSFNTGVSVSTDVVRVPYNLKDSSDSVMVELPMGDKMVLWDEFDPALYRLKVRVLGGDERLVEFGMREFRVKGTRFEVNGRPVYLRGTVENCVFPLTGYAPMDEAKLGAGVSNCEVLGFESYAVSFVLSAGGCF